MLRLHDDAVFRLAIVALENYLSNNPVILGLPVRKAIGPKAAAKALFTTQREPAVVRTRKLHDTQKLMLHRLGLYRASTYHNLAAGPQVTKSYWMCTFAVRRLTKGKTVRKSLAVLTQALCDAASTVASPLPPGQDRLYDVGRQASERQQPADVGDRHPLLLSKVCDRPGPPALDPPPPLVRANQGPDQALVRARLGGRHRRALGRHNQLPAAAALQSHRDVDGQSVDLEVHTLSHYSAASSKASEVAGAGCSWSASSATRLRIPQHAV